MKEKLINFRYVFYPFLAFFLGLMVSRKLFAGDLEVILLSVGLLAGTSLLLVFRKAYKPLILILSFFFLGNGFYYLGEISFAVKDYSFPVAVVGRVTDDFVDYGFSKSIVLDDVKIDGKSSANVRVVVKGSGPAFEVGDFIAFENIIEKSKPFTLNSFNSSDFRDGVRYRAEVNCSDLIVSKGYQKIDETIRQTIKARLYSHMSEKNAGISYAVLFGDKSAIDDATETAYKNSGIIHVLTVSGLHVGFLISLVYFVLKLFKANYWTRFIVTTLFIFFYAFICGFTPSVMRAGIMAVVFMLAKISGRRYDSLNSLGIAGFIICLLSPLTALDIGFQMSFFCVAGILMLAPTITKFLSKFIPYKIASLIALSISAQIGILPMLSIFGSAVNFLSVFANLLVVPAFSVIFPLLFVVAFISALIPFVGHLLTVVDYLLIAVNAIANFFASSGLSINLSPFKTTISSFYFIAVMILSKFLMAQSFVKFLMFSVTIFVMTISSGLFLIPPPAQSMVAFVGNKTQTSVIVHNREGEKLIIGHSYMLSRYLATYDIDYIDGFVALDFLGNDDMEFLSQSGVQTFIGDDDNKHNKNFIVLNQNVCCSIGQFKITFVSSAGKTLGVNISVDGQNIFVASSDKIDYNTNEIKSLLPSLVYAEDAGGNTDDFTLVSGAKEVESDYSLAHHGNMKFVFDENCWIMRGLD